MSSSSIIRLYFLKSFVRLLSLFVGFNCCVRLFITWIIKGNKIWEIRSYKEPECLRSSDLGNHGFLHLKNGLKMHYVESGNKSKPLMLFVHGFPEFWYSWRHQIKHFSKNYWVVAIDLRGYGDTDKPLGISEYTQEKLEEDVVQAIHSLGREKAIIVAHDYGGVVSMGVAQNYSHVVTRLILMNSPHFGASMMTAQKSIKQLIKTWYVYLFQLAKLPEIFLSYDDFYFLDVTFEGALTKDEILPYKYTFAREGSLSPPINYYRNIYTKKFMLNPYDHPVINVETLMIWGTNDLALERGIAENTRHFIKNLRIHYIEGGTHFIQQDRPEEVNNRIDQFLKLGNC